MALESISTEPVIEKLKNLREYMPEEEETIYQFGAYLADKIGEHSKLAPQGFKIAADLGLYDLQEGVDGFTGKPIQSSLVGYPPQIYTLLGMRIADLADATCSEEFAKEVRAFDEQINAKIREDRAK
jgi:hypothetical protein